MTTGCSIVITTTNTQESVDAIIAAALDSELAACVQVYPVVSHYIWRGARQKDDEFLIQMKIKTQDFADLRRAIRAVHPYETPEIIRLDIAEADESYRAWIMASTRSSA